MAYTMSSKIDRSDLQTNAHAARGRTFNLCRYNGPTNGPLTIEG